ncbi:XRE family transcriptional regulator [bacterium 1XD42-1]|nr:XRE family transcriptional regulator [bacterium 1XD42-8]RKJ64024.1 XRE family transcriptional regulator [bacterium 1XD42-1]
MDLKAIGRRIQKARKAKGLTQEQLAEIVGLSPTHISVIERGVKGPKLETFIDIANALEVTADGLLLDVLNCSMPIRITGMSEQMKNLPIKEQRKISKIIEILIDENNEIQTD